MSSPSERQFTELLDWLKARNEKLRAFALRSGIDKSQLHRLVHGRITKRIDLTLPARLASATDNEIGHEQLGAYLHRLSQLETESDAA